VVKKTNNSATIKILNAIKLSSKKVLIPDI
jgi:hypothetical protein